MMIYYCKKMRHRTKSKLKRLALAVCIVNLGLLLIYKDIRQRFKGVNMETVGKIFLPANRPRLWRDFPASEVLKIYRTTLKSTYSALASCTQPARALSDVTGPRNPLEQLLASEPPGKLQARPRDVAAYRKAWTWINQTPERRQQYSRFGPKLTPEKKAQLLLTWRVVHEALKLHNISHYLVGGSLMGALRHRGIIPWDDDIDIAVDDKDVKKINRALSCIPGYTLHLQRNLHWKFFPNNAHIMAVYANATVVQPKVLSENRKPNYTVKWHPRKKVVRRSPFVDLFLMKRDKSYTWSYRNLDIGRCFFHLEDVYPLTSIFFEGYLVPVPRRSHSIVNKIYQANICVSEVLDHLDGTSTLEFKDRASVDCRKLAPIYTVYHVVSYDYSN